MFSLDRASAVYLSTQVLLSAFVLPGYVHFRSWVFLKFLFCFVVGRYTYYWFRRHLDVEVPWI